MYQGVTVSRGWDLSARLYSRKEDGFLGDEWCDPRGTGIAVPANELVHHLDSSVFAPFLGTGRVMLEIGAGGGRFTEVLLPKCERLIAVDTSAAMLKLLRQRFAGTDRIEYMHADGKGLSGVGDGSVDAVFSYGVFVHIQHWDIFNYLVETKRVLRPGGKAIIHHSNTFTPLGWNKFVYDLPTQLGRHKSFDSFTVMTPDLMRELVRRAGLQVVDILTEIVPRDCITLIAA
jgi:ubiquinone/menaquinone biosynthesis C-methylase UbiE